MTALRVLLIEDEPMIALLFEEVLSEMGHEVCAIERTEVGAIAAAELYRPDLIIADAHLHEGSGVSAVNRILEAGFVPHIFVSGERLDQASLDHAAAVLQKPFSEENLIAAIERVLEMAASRPA